MLSDALPCAYFWIYFPSKYLMIFLPIFNLKFCNIATVRKWVEISVRVWYRLWGMLKLCPMGVVSLAQPQCWWSARLFSSRWSNRRNRLASTKSLSYSNLHNIFWHMWRLPFNLFEDNQVHYKKTQICLIWNMKCFCKYCKASTRITTCDLNNSK